MYSTPLITSYRCKAISYPTWGRGSMTAACWVQLHGAYLLRKCGLSVHT